MQEAKSSDHDAGPEWELLLRVLVRGMLRAETIVTREEAMTVLPSCCDRRWFDAHVKKRQVAFVGEHALYRWGDVVAALNGTPRAPAAGADRYLTIEDAAAYLRCPSVAALRMAVARKHIAPSARRGRTLLFTRADLDAQIMKNGAGDVEGFAGGRPQK